MAVRVKTDQESSKAVRFWKYVYICLNIFVPLGITQILIQREDVRQDFSESLLKPLNVKSFAEVLVISVCAAFAYVLLYIGVAWMFFTTGNLKETLPRSQIALEIRLSCTSVFLLGVGGLLWINYMDPFGPWYGHFKDKELTYSSLLLGAIGYIHAFDAWFYWTHRLLHHRILWHPVHLWHHRLRNPSPFAQYAVHPFEAALQGVGHFLASWFVPIHPLLAASFGLQTMIFAIAAHDARDLDLNDHIAHHYFLHFNYAIFLPWWDWLMGTRWSGGEELESRKVESGVYKAVDELNG